MAKQQPKPGPKEAPKQKPKVQKAAPQGPSFLQFLMSKEQRIDWAIIGGLFVLILIFLKVYYPYPELETDSGNYVLSAATGKINGYRPYGYSGFLGFFHGLSSDVRFVVSWQWFLTFISATLFLFTIKFIFRGLPRMAFYLLCVLCILNPSLIYMDAYIMSDSLFVSLTLMFLTSCIWIIYSGSYIAMVANLILLWWCMDTRYIGLFYPVFSAAALSWAMFKRFKWGGVAIAIVPIAMLFMYRAGQATKMNDEFGVETFSAFGGWQKANNGVSILPYVQVDAKEITDPQMKSIHDIVRQFPDSFFRTEDIMATSFMWTKNYPGKQCLYRYIQQTNTPYMKAWAYMGTQMDAYGSWLQSRYPMDFAKHYLWPNFKNIFKVYEINEYKEFNTDANMKAFFPASVDKYTYKTQFFKPMTSIRQICDSIVWILVVLSSLAGIAFFKKINWTIDQKIITAMFILFIAAFSGASTIAAPINNFRYMMPMLYLQIAIPILIISAIMKSMQQKEETKAV